MLDNSNTASHKIKKHCVAECNHPTFPFFFPIRATTRPNVSDRYHPARLIAGEPLGKQGRLSPFWAMWAANILLTAIGIPVIVRAIRESGPISWGWLLRPWRALQAPRVAPERQP